MTAVTQLTHHGMIFVPPGYTFGPSMFDLAALHGGSPWGAGTFAGPTGDRKPSEMELAYAKHQARERTRSRRLSCCSCCRRGGRRRAAGGPFICAPQSRAAEWRARARAHRESTLPES